MYRFFIAPFVRRMNPEKASVVAMRYFKLFGRIPGARMFNRLIHGNRPGAFQREVFGLYFYNPIGLGAGLDRDADLYNDLNDLGFSFSEVGPMGEDNIRKAVDNIQKDKPDDILAICINADFLRCFSLAYDFCDFFVMEIPQISSVETILNPILETRLTYEEYKPIVVKLPEKIGKQELDYVLGYCMMNGVDGIQARNLNQIKAIMDFCKGRLPIIANCHVQSAGEVAELLDAGASLIEIRTGLVYEGPSLVRRILNYLEKNESRIQNCRTAETTRQDA